MKICGRRIGNRTKHLVRKFCPVIRHRDIDEVAALSLIDCRGFMINIDSYHRKLSQ